MQRYKDCDFNLRELCANAYGAIYPMAFAMRLTDKMEWETKDYFDVVCPHGGVTYRITRVRGTA